MKVRVLLILAAISFSATAFAQGAPPKIGNKPLVLVKLKEPTGCKLVGTVKGTRLWAGDCVASELSGATPATETKPLSGQDIEAIPPRSSRARAESEEMTITAVPGSLIQ
jgi:hypothetical protein